MKFTEEYCKGKSFISTLRYKDYEHLGKIRITDEYVTNITGVHYDAATKVTRIEGNVVSIEYYEEEEDFHNILHNRDTIFCEMWEDYEIRFMPKSTVIRELTDKIKSWMIQ